VIVDSSALVALLLREPGWKTLLDLASAPGPRRVGAPTLVETGIVLSARLGVAGKTLLARLVTELELDVVPLDERLWMIAVDAYARFGKGWHPAGLNFGDCLTYAVCQAAGEPLLCLGDDFRRTDLPVCELPAT